MKTKENNTSVTIYKTEEGAQVSTVFDKKGEVWLSATDIAKLYGRNVKTILKHIGITKEEVEVVVAKFATQYPQSPLRTINGKKSKTTKTVEVEHFNLDTILRIGYRVKSKEASIFRDWATWHLANIAKDGYSISTMASDSQLNDLLIDASIRLRSINSSINSISSSLLLYKGSKHESVTQMKIIRMLLCNAATKMNPVMLIEFRNDATSPNCGMRPGVELAGAKVLSAVSYMTPKELKTYARLSETVAHAIMIGSEPGKIRIAKNIAMSAIKTSGFGLTNNSPKYKNKEYSAEVRSKAMYNLDRYIKTHG